MAIRKLSARRLRPTGRRYTRRIGSRRRSLLSNRKSIGYQTTAMPLSRVSKMTYVPRSLSYDYLPDNFRCRLIDSVVTRDYLSQKYDEPSSYYYFGPHSFVFSPSRLVVPNNNSHLSFQFNRLMSLYSRAQVDYVQYTVQFSELGIFSGDDEPGQYDSINSGMQVASLFLADSDTATFSDFPPFSTPAVVASTLPSSKFSIVHRNGNQDTVTHTHALDINSWFKEPSSSLRTIRSYFPNQPGDSFSPSIDFPQVSADDPTFVIFVQNSSIVEAHQVQHHYALFVKIEYHVTFSVPHLPSFGQSFPVN